MIFWVDSGRLSVSFPLTPADGSSNISLVLKNRCFVVTSEWGLVDGEKRKKSYFLEAKPETEISSLVDLLPDFLRWIFSPRSLCVPDDTGMCAHGANRSSITIPTVITYYAHSLHTRSLGVNKAEIIYTHISPSTKSIIHSTSWSLLLPRWFSTLSTSSPPWQR